MVASFQPAGIQDVACLKLRVEHRGCEWKTAQNRHVFQFCPTLILVPGSGLGVEGKPVQNQTVSIPISQNHGGAVCTDTRPGHRHGPASSGLGQGKAETLAATVQ